MERRTLKSYTDKDGNYHKGIEEELRDLESEISGRGADENKTSGQEVDRLQGAAIGRRPVNELRKEAAKLRAEIARRNQKKQELRKKYNIDEKGNISLEDLSRMFRDLNSNKAIGKCLIRLKSIEERAQSKVYPPTQEKSVGYKVNTFEELYVLAEEIRNNNKKTDGTEVLRTSTGIALPDNGDTSGNADGRGYNRQSRQDDSDGGNRGARKNGRENSSGRNSSDAVSKGTQIVGASRSRGGVPLSFYHSLNTANFTTKFSTSFNVEFTTTI